MVACGLIIDMSGYFRPGYETCVCSNIAALRKLIADAVSLKRYKITIHRPTSGVNVTVSESL